MQESALAAIKASPIFGGLREPDLLDLLAGGTYRSVSPGTCLLEEGETGDSLLVILSGEVEVVRESGDRETSLARMGPGSFVGEMSLIDDAPRNATVRSITEAEVFEITKEQFEHLLDTSPDACRTLVRTVLRRLKSTEAMLVNQEKLAGLGRLSAGLAHELNNPASAIVRFADQLATSIEEWRSATQSLLGRADPSLSSLARRLDKPGDRPDPAPLSALDVALLEEQLADWLSSHGVDDPWEIATNLAATGWTIEQLDHVSAETGPEGALPEALSWLSSDASIRLTLREIRTSATRMSQIVSSVKRYSHMDRADIERLNVNDGVRDTLVILKHKLRGVQLEVDLTPDMPDIEGHPGELNQVWTNLVDNAIDAVEGNGIIRIDSRLDDRNVLVTVTDNGPGISAEHRSRLFEPFFTTKDVGVGTGLGLHISHNIIERHRGTIEVTSRPGETSFVVRLPRSISSSSST